MSLRCPYGRGEPEHAISTVSSGRVKNYTFKIIDKGFSAHSVFKRRIKESLKFGIERKNSLKITRTIKIERKRKTKAKRGRGKRHPAFGEQIRGKGKTPYDASQDAKQREKCNLGEKKFPNFLFLFSPK